MSIYHIAPLAVVFPENEQDVCALVRLARSENISLTARGGGSGTGGAALGRGVVIDFGNMRRIRIPNDIKQHRVVEVQPGVRHSTLQRALGEHGLFLPPQPSSSELSLIGGNIATKAAGARALRYGSIDRWVHNLRCVGAQATPFDSAEPAGLPPTLCAGLNNLRAQLWQQPAALQRLRATRARKSASGYNLAPFLDLPPAAHSPHSPDNPDSPDNPHSPDRQACARLVRELLVGSVGTLGLITNATLRCKRLPRARTLIWALFPDIDAACRAAPRIAEYGAASVELLDSICLQIAPPPFLDRSRFLDQSRSADSTLLLIELLEEADDDDTRAAANPAGAVADPTGANPAGANPADANSTDAGVDLAGESLAAQTAALQQLLARMHCAQGIIGDSSRQHAVRRWRAGLLFAIRNWQGRRAMAVVNDVGVPPNQMANFIVRARKYCAHLDLPVPIYGHAASGNLHLRPLFDPGQDKLQQQIAELAEYIYAVVIEMGGTITAEHGMGPLRAPFLKAEWGPELYEFMRSIKRLLDPADLLNPGAIFALSG